VTMVDDGGALTREMRVDNKTSYNTLTAVRKQVGTVQQCRAVLACTLST
jgi:hypothetical protein